MPEAESPILTNLEPELRAHLKGVYLCLSTTAASTAVGCGLYYGEFAQYGILSSLMTFGLIAALHFFPDNGKNFWFRFLMVVCFGFCAGQLLGPLMQFVALVDQKLIISSLVGSTAIYLSLTLTAIFSPARKYLFLNGILIAMCNTMTIMSLLNIFVKSYLVQYMQLHLGVAVMAGFVLYNTQVIMEKFRSGDHDSINHSIGLFFDMVNLLRKVLVLLAERRRDVEL